MQKLCSQAEQVAASRCWKPSVQVVPHLPSSGPSPAMAAAFAAGGMLCGGMEWFGIIGCAYVALGVIR